MSYNIFCTVNDIFEYMFKGILCANVTGICAYGIWLQLSKRAARFCVHWGMTILRLIIIMFSLPVGIGVVQGFVFRFGPLPKDFFVTNGLKNASVILAGLWLVELVGVLLYRYWDYCKIRDCFLGSQPVEEESVLEIAQMWKEELGIEAPFQMFYNDTVTNPFLLYYRGYRIIIPLSLKDSPYMSVILLHELVHLMQGHMRMKNMGFVVRAMHPYNPFTKGLQRQIDKWVEVECDQVVCEIGARHFTKRDYFLMILKMKEDSQETKKSEFMCSLFENKKQLEFRVEQSKELSKGKKKKWFLALVIAMFLAVLAGTLVMIDYGLKVTEENTMVYVQMRQTPLDYEIIKENEFFAHTSVQKLSLNEIPVEDAKYTLAENEILYIPVNNKNNLLITYMIELHDKGMCEYGYLKADKVHKMVTSKDVSGQYENEGEPTVLLIKNVSGQEIELEIAVSQIEM